MMKSFFVFVGCLIVAAEMAGAAVRRQLNIVQSSVPETETIAPERMEFVYAYSWCADTAADRRAESRQADNMLLQIAPGGLSKFSSYRNLTVDSILMQSSVEQIASAAAEGRLGNGEPMTIFKNYPAGRLTHVEKVCRDWFRYEEDMPRIEWEQTDTAATVLGYECRGARCRFGGREWTVLYAEDIPLAEGPWKLCGLPGMIMKAEDGRGDYVFECIGLRSQASRPVTVYKVPYNVVSRREFYDAKHRYDVNPFAYFETTTGGHVTVTDGAGNPLAGAYDPEELTYDYIETDWRR